MNKNLIDFATIGNKIISKITINVMKNNKTFEDWIENFKKFLQSYKEYKFSKSFLSLEFKIKEKEFDFYEVVKFLDEVNKFKKINPHQIKIVLDGINSFRLFSSRIKKFSKCNVFTISFTEENNKILFDLSQKFFEKLKISTFQIENNNVVIDFTNKIDLSKCDFSFAIDSQLIVDSSINLDNFLYFLNHSIGIIVDEIFSFNTGTINLKENIKVFDCETFEKIYPIFQNIDFENSKGCKKITIKNFSFNKFDKNGDIFHLKLDIFLKNVEEVVFDGLSKEIKDLRIVKYGIKEDRKKLKRLILKNFDIETLIIYDSTKFLDLIQIENSKISKLFLGFSYGKSPFLKLINNEISIFGFYGEYILNFLEVKNLKIKEKIFISFIHSDYISELMEIFKISKKDFKYKDLFLNWIEFLFKIKIKGNLGFINFVKNVFLQNKIEINFEVENETTDKVIEVFDVLKKYKIKSEREIDFLLNFFEMKKMIKEGD